MNFHLYQIVYSNKDLKNSNNFKNFKLNKYLRKHLRDDIKNKFINQQQF